MAYVYKPDGFPWARFIITILYDIIFAGTLWALLSNHASMATEEVSIVSMMITAMAAGWTSVHSFWYRMDSSENGTNGQNGTTQDPQPTPDPAPITTPPTPTAPAPTPAPQPPIDEEAERNRSFTAAQAAKRQET